MSQGSLKSYFRGCRPAWPAGQSQPVVRLGQTRNRSRAIGGMADTKQLPVLTGFAGLLSLSESLKVGLSP